MRMIKRLNFLQVLGIIIMLIAFILDLFNVKLMESLFFAGIAINGLGFTKLTIKWSKEGKTGFKKMDKNYNKNLTRKSSDTLLIINIVYYLVLCFDILLDVMEDNFFKSPFSLMPILVFSLVSNFVLLLFIDGTYKQVVEIIKPKNKNNLKK